jgi:hypothetical protein
MIERRRRIRMLSGEMSQGAGGDQSHAHPYTVPEFGTSATFHSLEH